MIKFNYVIFHRGCPDGFTSLVLLMNENMMTKNAIILADVPYADKMPSNIENKNVVIIDVAYNKKVVEHIFKNAKRVLFIDHHDSVHDDIVLLKKKYNTENSDKETSIMYIYDDKECGATLTWKYLYPNKPIPLFIKYIKDNDVGIWKIKNIHEFITGLNVYCNCDLNSRNITKWKQIMYNKQKMKMIMKKGITYMEYIKHMFDNNIFKASLNTFPGDKIYNKFKKYFKKRGQYKVAAYCGMQCLINKYIPLIFDKFKCDFIIYWIYNIEYNKYILVLRSRKVDVGTIAKLLGNGGGHKYASACSFYRYEYDITDLFYK